VRPIGVAFWGGNAAMDTALVTAELAPPTRRVTATLLGGGSLAAVVLAVAIAWRRRRWLVAAVALCTCWIAFAGWPPLSLMEADATTRWLFAGTPRIPDGVTGAERALAERSE
jgi:hypothetical protein